MPPPAKLLNLQFQSHRGLLHQRCDRQFRLFHHKALRPRCLGRLRQFQQTLDKYLGIAEGSAGEAGQDGTQA